MNRGRESPFLVTVAHFRRGLNREWRELGVGFSHASREGFSFQPYFQNLVFPETISQGEGMHC